MLVIHGEFGNLPDMLDLDYSAGFGGFLPTGLKLVQRWVKGF